MGFCEAASITVPDTEGETYVVVSMQPLSEIRNGRATAYRHVLICDLTVKRSAARRLIQRHASAYRPYRPPARVVTRRIAQWINRATSTIQRHQDVGFAHRQVLKGGSSPRSRPLSCCAADLDTCSE